MHAEFVFRLKMSQKFSHDDDELLIEQVREYPCIYDHANKDFKDHQIRENAWNKIGVVLLKKCKYACIYLC